MRAMSAAALKRGKQTALQSYPREGSKIRQFYDALNANKGLITYYPTGKQELSYMANCLRDYYGLDVRYMGKGQWILAGEWFGVGYVDYCAERAEQNDARK